MYDIMKHDMACECMNHVLGWIYIYIYIYSKRFKQCDLHT